MKILITSDWYKPAINGVVTSVENLARGLTDAGHEVRILTLSGNRHSRHEKNVYFIGSLSAGVIYEKARLRLLLPAAMKKELLEWQPDVVHSQCEFSTFGIAKEIALRCDAPLLHTYHTVYEDYTHYFFFNEVMGRKLARIFTKKILSEVDSVIVPSEKIETLLKDYGVHKPIYDIPSGINLQHFTCNRSQARRRIREDLGIKEDECVLLYLGRVAKEKNIEEILEFLKKMDDKQKLLIVGDGPNREHLEDLAEKEGLKEQVIFAGMVDPSEVPDYYAAGDIFVSASQSETQGMTYIEAMASSLPLLCRADVCLKGVVDNGKNGFLYRNEEEFMDYFALLQSKASFRKEMGDLAAKSIQNRYSIQSFARSCLKAYEAALAAREVGVCA